MQRIPVADLVAILGDWTRGGGTRAEALAAALDELVAGGRLLPGTTLPAERRLAEALAVSRGTVVRAYERLRADGVADTVHGRGTSVRRDAGPGRGGTTLVRQQRRRTGLLLPPPAVADGPDGSDVVDLRGAWVAGAPPPGPDVLAALAERVAAAWPQQGWLDAGLPALREAVADLLTGAGLDSGPDQVVVTSGAQQAIALVAQLLLRRGDVVLTEDVTYAGALDAFVAHGARVVGVPVDRPGVNLAGLRAALRRHRPALVYLNPSVHNPTGTVLPGPARQLLGEALVGSDAHVVDDRSQAYLQWRGRPPAPLAAHVPATVARRVLTVGSMSKPAWTGLRVGWLRVDRALVPALARLRATADLGGGVAGQVLADELLRRGHPPPGRLELLRRRCDLLQALLAERLPRWRVEPPAGGLALWVDTGLRDADAFVPVAAAHGVLLLPGAAHRPDEATGPYLRLPFGLVEDDLRLAVDRLVAAWRSHLAALPDGRPA